MADKFLQRAVPDNVLLVTRKLTEDVNLLKYREKASGASVSGDGGSGGLSVSTATVSSDVTGVEDTHHILNLTSMTANQNFNFPTPSYVGARCKVSISAGNNTYALILKVNGTETTRLFITNETIEYTAYGTGAADWQLSQNNTIACLAVLERTTAQAIASGVFTEKVQFNSAVANIGGMADIVTNFEAKIRRNGFYDIGAYAAINNIDDTEVLQVHIYIDGVIADFGGDLSPAVNKFLTSQVVKKYYLTAGQTVRMYIYHNEGASQNTDTTYKPQLWVEEVAGTAGVSGGAAPTATLVEVNLGSAWVWRGRFTITDAAITAAKKVLVWLAPGPYTGKGTRTDEMELTPIEIIGVVPGSGSAVVTWETKLLYANTPIIANGGRVTNTDMDREYYPKRINKVRGNVKFYYQILS